MRRIRALLTVAVLLCTHGLRAAASDTLDSPQNLLAEEIADSIEFGPLSADSIGAITRAAEPRDELTQDPAVHPASMIAGGARPTGCEQWQLLPEGLIYRPYLAGVKESRLSCVWNYDNGNGRIWDINLGGQVPLVRYGTVGGRRPTGFQISMEGAGQVRLDWDEDGDVEATDYRFGVPITWGDEVRQTKFAFYHLSSHLGDEFLLKNFGFPRLNYSENVLVLGQSLQIVDDWRVYAEAGYGVDVEIAEPWEFQFGLEWAPETWTGFRGAPFAAFNGYLREEVDFGGNAVAQVGWAWRRDEASGLLRMGLQYYTGKNQQFSLFDDSEQKYGFGIWYDY